MFIYDKNNFSGWVSTVFNFEGSPHVRLSLGMESAGHIGVTTAPVILAS